METPIPIEISPPNSFLFFFSPFRNLFQACCADKNPLKKILKKKNLNLNLKFNTSINTSSI